MTRTFIQTTEFSRKWEKLGLNDNDLRRLELVLLKNPKEGNVISGTGRLRKLRFACEHAGKSGSIRICYVDYALYDTIYLITLYSKNEKENLTVRERNDIKKAIIVLESTLKQGVHHE